MDKSELVLEAAKVKHPLVREQDDDEGKFGGYDLLNKKEISINTDNVDVPYTLKVYKFPQGNDFQLQKLRIELTKENDIYFVYKCEITKDNYQEMIGNKKINATFGEFPSKLNSLLENVQTNRTVFSAIFTLSDKEGNLAFKQKLQFKTVQIFNLKFTEEDREDQYTIAQAQFRFDEKSSDLEAAKIALSKLYDHVEKQNKALYNQLKRGQEFKTTRK